MNDTQREHNRLRLALSVYATAVVIACSSMASAQTVSQGSSPSQPSSPSPYGPTWNLTTPGPYVGPASPWPDFFDIAVPGSLSATLFGGGFGSDKYGTVDEGFQLEQSVTRYIGLVGRITGYELFIGQGFDDPLAPGAGPHSQLNFARFQGGLDFAPISGTHLIILGGGDAGDSHAAVVEGSLSTWLLVHTRHPVNIAADVNYDSQNGVTSSTIDIQAVAYAAENYLIIAGGGGAIYGGGFIGAAEGQGGPDLGFYYRPWRAGIQIQAGYGAPGGYGQATIYKQFAFLE